MSVDSSPDLDKILYWNMRQNFVLEHVCGQFPDLGKILY